MSKTSIIFISVLVTLIAGWLIIAPSVQRKLEVISCGNSMASIGFAARLWASDHEGQLPSDFLSMSNELIITKILICPGDHLRQMAGNWAAFTPKNSSYEIVTIGLRDSDTNTIFFRCTVHGNLGFADGTVFDGVSRRTKFP